MADDREAIHTWFSLSYANYLVLPRSVLQSMPDQWQKTFVESLEELDAAFGHLDHPEYEVKCLARPREYIGEYDPCPNCVSPDEADPECELCGGAGQLDRDEPYETAEEVGYREDPIPHYNRGRTRLEPAASKPKQGDEHA